MKNQIKKLLNKTSLVGKILRVAFVVLTLVVVLFAGVFVLKNTGLWQKVNSMEKIRKIVESGGVFSFLIFILLQILQTTILQIPAFFVTVSGALVFGKWQAFFMSYFAIMVGSVLMFFIGRKAGGKFLNWLVGKESAEKWKTRMEKGKYLFLLMMLFPMFPDDILCVVAGMSDMSFKFFFWTNIVSRGIGIAATVFFGSGAVIPFKDFGLIIWCVIIVFILVLFYLSVKYQNKIDEILNQILSKSKKNKNEK